MGWSTGWDSRKELVKELLADNEMVHVIKHASTNYGRNLWAVMEQNATGKRFIMLFLLQSYKGDWGYKPVDESMGPVEVDCPLSLLDLAGDPEGQYAIEWRAKVRRYHARASARHKIGDVVKVYGEEYKIVRKIKRSWVGERLSDGRPFRLPTKKIVATQTAVV
jgi:hypothetical protein